MFILSVLKGTSKEVRYCNSKKNTKNVFLRSNKLYNQMGRKIKTITFDFQKVKKSDK